MSIKKLFFLTLASLAMGVSSCTTINDVDDDEYIPKEEVHERYLVTFLNYDNSFLYSTQVEPNRYTLRTLYAGNTPTRESDDLFDYSFGGWTIEGDTSDVYSINTLFEIESDITFNAFFNSTAIVKHTVTFLNYDGTLLYEALVKDGEQAIYSGDTPTRESDGQYTYTFHGWNKSTYNITENTTLVAVYDSESISYTVTFKNYDGSVLDIQYTKYGGGVIYSGKAPERPSRGDKSYVFTGWDRTFKRVIEDIDVYALYEEVDRVIYVNYLNYDGTVLYTATTYYGGSVSYYGSTPTRLAEGRYQYVFTGWDQETTELYSDIDVRAQYRQEARISTTGLDYYYYDNYVYVSSYSGSERDIYIPSTYNGYPVLGIGSSAFYNSSIVSIFIEDEVRTIDYRAFYNCRQLSSIRFPSNLESLGGEVFYNCSKLTSLEIPASVSSIDRTTFNNYQNVDGVTINSSNPYFSIKNGLLLDKQGKTLYFPIKAIPTSSPITIPEGVEVIEGNAFSGYQNTSVSFPSTLNTIRSSAFSSCSRITNLVFPDSLERIESDAFSYCTNVQSITFGDNLQFIGSSAFYGDRYLSSVSFPNTLEVISNGAFSACGLTSIDFNNCPAKIYSNAFDSNSNLTNINFGSNINQIQSRAFAYCYLLTSITLPKSLTYLDSEAFYECNNIRSFNVAAGSQYTSYDGVIYNSSFTTIVYFPPAKSGTFRINGSFSGTIDLYSHFFNRSVTDFSVDENNPNYCSIEGSLYSKNKKHLYAVSKTVSTITFPAQLESIGSEAFQGNYSISRIDASKSNLKQIGNYAFAYRSDLQYISLPEGLESIGTEAFNYCYELKSINLPSTLTSIGNNCFYYCQSLTSITIPDSVVSIGENAFSECHQLKSAKLSANIEQIGQNTFNGCSSLTSITIPKKVLSIADYAFNGCYQLMSATFESGSQLTNIGEGAFKNCSSLSNITIPYGVTNVGNSCFQYCNSLANVTLPNSVTTIGTYSFADTASLNSIVLSTSLTSIGAYAFQNSSIRSITLPSSLITINRYSFNCCTGLTSVTISYGTKTIDSNAFYNCTQLTTVNMPNSVTSINSYAFYGCSSLKSISLSTNLETIQEYAFYNCRSLPSIIIPDKVLTIGSNAFSYCTQLASVVIGSSVTTINSYAFRYCTSLSSITFKGTKVSYIGYYAFDNTACKSIVLVLASGARLDTRCLEGITNIYFKGTYEEWLLVNKSGFSTYYYIYYYSENEPTEEEYATGLNYWHYVNSSPTQWVQVIEEQTEE